MRGIPSSSFFGLFLFLGEERVPMKEATGTENQKDTLITGCISGRMVLITSLYGMLRISELDSYNTTCARLEDHWDRA